MHAIGDAAFDQAVMAIEAALKDFPREDHRHGIIHACLPSEEGLQKCAELGIQIPLQPAFLMWDLEPLEFLESILGDRAERISPLRKMTDMGIVLSGGSDAPCTLPDPIARYPCRLQPLYSRAVPHDSGGAETVHLQRGLDDLR